MIMDQDTNDYWEQLERLEKLIRASEFKAGVIFSFHSLILGLFMDRLDKFEPILKESSLFLALSAFWLISVVISIYYCFRCFKPHMELKYDKNVFFFGDATKNFGSVKDYSKELIKVCANTEEIVDKLSEQIHAESVIITKKFDHVKRAIQFFIISFIFVMISLSYWIFLAVT